MAGADVIGTAICVALLIIVAYVVAGSILTTSGVIFNAQNDMTKSQQGRMDTAIQILDDPEPSFSVQPDSTQNLTFHVKNTGLEIIRNFYSMDVFFATQTDPPIRYKFNATSVDSWGNRCGNENMKTWNYYYIEPDDINPSMLDPGEEMVINICNFGSSPNRYMIGVITPNGVSAFYTK